MPSRPLNSSAKALLFVLATCYAAAVSAQQPMTTYQGNMQRQGWNQNETSLTQSNVNSSTFGLLFTLPVDGQVYAEPLYVPGVTVPNQGVHNVVYVCTQHDTLFAFDADNGGNPLWQVNFGPSVPNGDTGTDDINPEVGITGTPVIKMTGTGTGYIYLVAKTKETDGQGSTVYVQRLHAIDITDGNEMTGSPVVIQASVPGTGEGSDGTNVAFNPLIQAQRPALLLLNNTVYIGWASHGDNGPYHGWIMSYDSNTLQQTGVFNTTPNALNDPSGYPIAAGGVWQGGGGLASDGNSLFFSTGNGTFNPSNGSYGDSILRMSLPNLAVGDYFTPADQQGLDNSDEDLGSGGVMLLPPSVGSATAPNLLVQSGKEGSLYLVNTANMGQYDPNADHVVQELPGVMGGIWGNPSYYNGHIYYGGSGWPITEFTVSNGQFTSTSPVNTTNYGFGYPGPTPTVSSNGAGNGIVWAIDTSGYSNGSPAVLLAFNADTLATLYNSSETDGRDVLPSPAKFAVPLVANGKVYVGATGSVSVFGLGQWAAAPTANHQSGTYQSAISVTVSDDTSGAQIYYTTDGSVPTTSSTLYTGPISVSNSETLTLKAFASGYGPSGASVYQYQIHPYIGTGTGLTGTYYSNMTLSAPAAGSRIDRTVDFNWNGNSPIAGLGGTQWSAIWTGRVLAPSTGNYVFQMQSDDGCRLYVNGTKVIDAWVDQAPTYYNTAPIALQAGHQYSITMEYYQNGGGSVAQLSWSGPGFNFEVIPSTQLTGTSYPLQGLYTASSTLTGGSSTTGVLQISASAPAGGQAVSLSSNNSALQVPSTATVPSGKTGVTFPVTTSAVSSVQTVLITATYNSVSLETQVVVNPYALSNFYTTPTSVNGGVGARGVVQLVHAAGSGGEVVRLSRGDTNVTIPGYVTVPAGQSGVSFAITTSGVSSADPVSLSATAGPSTLNTTLTLNVAPITRFYASPSGVTGGTSTYGVVQLSGQAGPGGSAVSISSGDSNVTVPATVTVPAGKSGASFAISTSAVSSADSVTLTATYNSTSLQTTVTVNPSPLSNFYVTPSSFKGGTTVHGVVQLAHPAGPGGDVVSLSSPTSSVTVPATVTVPAGSTGVSFLITTGAVSSTTQVQLTATFGSSAKQTTVTLNP